MNELSIIPDSKELVRQSTDIASLCREIVIASAIAIQGRKYVRVEGWQAIATAHGCVASARDVKRVEGGMVATGEIRRMQDGQLIATAEGFVGEDEPTWYGGESKTWDRFKKQEVVKILPKRPEYAIRAMAQTRAISRACRGCFAHVVVLMDAGLSTTPAEEVPEGGFTSNFEEPKTETTPEPAPAITDDQAKAGNIAKLRTILDKNRSEMKLQDFEKAFCMIASGLTENRAQSKLDDFTLAELRSLWPKRAEIISEIVNAAAAK